MEEPEPLLRKREPAWPVVGIRTSAGATIVSSPFASRIRSDTLRRWAFRRSPGAAVRSESRCGSAKPPAWQAANVPLVRRNYDGDRSGPDAAPRPISQRDPVPSAFAAPQNPGRILNAHRSEREALYGPPCRCLSAGAHPGRQRTPAPCTPADTPHNTDATAARRSP